MTDQSPYLTSFREEELKNRVSWDWSGAFGCSRVIGNSGFCVDIPAKGPVADKYGFIKK